MSTAGQFLRFLIVGGFSTGLQYLILFLLVHFGAWEATLASSIGYVLSAVVNFYLNHRISFASNVPYSVAALSFTLVALTGLALNGLFMAVLVHGAGQHYFLSQILTTGIVLIWNFYANRHWTYKATPGMNEGK